MPSVVTPTPIVPSPAVAMPEQEKASIWIPIKLAVVPVVAVGVTIWDERNAPEAEAVGYWIGMMLLPLLIALAAVRFKPAKRMRTFSTIFCLIGLIGMGATVASVHDGHFGRQKTPQEIVQEAAGTKPVTDSGTPSERKVNRLMRDFISDMLAARKKHDADAAAVTPVLSTLYTAQSFSSKQQMADAITALKKIREVDGAMTEKLEHLPEEMKARVDASDLDTSDKKDVMIGFQKTYGNSEILPLYHEIRLDEEQWVAASVDLYSFASQHAAKIQVKDKQIVIADADLLVQFNAKFKTSRDLRNKMRDGNHRLAALQEASMQKTGISKSDLGLK